VTVADSKGRVATAVRYLLSQLVTGTTAPALALVADAGPGWVRLRMRRPGKACDLAPVAQLVAGLGGSAGGSRDGEMVEAWLKLHRA
jgi:hypothetical protein